MTKRCIGWTGFLMALVLFSLALSAQAEYRPSFPHQSIPLHYPVTHTCMVNTSLMYGIPLDVLYAVLEQEGGTVGHTSPPRHQPPYENGTRDMGPAQINTLWLEKLKRWNLEEKHVIHNGCINVHLMGWRLNREIKQVANFWTGVGNYHSRTNKHHYPYVFEVWEKLKDLDYESILRSANGGKELPRLARDKDTQ